MMKKILFVAFPTSIHMVRWVNQLRGQGWDIHLFPSIRGEAIHPELSDITIHHWFYSERLYAHPRNKSFASKVLDKFIDRLRGRIVDRLFPFSRARELNRLIHRLQPDIVHSLEIQAAGYLTLKAKQMFHGIFPSWIVTNWGSDIYYFGQFPQHQERIRNVLANCDYYSCECERDVKLAFEFGFIKNVLPVFPNTGGFNLESMASKRSEIQTSKRTLIMLKGYQNWAGRALVGLDALERCADILAGYQIVIYSAAQEVIAAAKLFTKNTGIPTSIVPIDTAHEKMLMLHAQARVSIGISMSDAISTSLLEAIVMGSFPIQSCTACAEEWIEHGVSGMIVPPEDPDIIEKAIRTALTDDELVNKAAKINWLTAKERLDGDLLKQKAIEMYNAIVEE